MLRIRTTIGEGRVFTLFFMGKWVTLLNDGKKTSSTDATNLADAGLNHLAYSQKLRKIVDERANHTSKLLPGPGCSGSDSGGVASSNGESHRTGTHGDDRGERDENLPSDSSSTEDKDSSQFGPQDTELDNG